MEWLQRFLGHLSKMLLIPFSSPPPPHHPSNGSLFRAPSVTTVTVHKRVGRAKRFGNGKCGQASHSASISSLSSSLFGTFATLRLTWLFFFELWLSWCYLLTYIYFLACQSVCPFTECLPEAILTEIWICCTSKIVGNPFVFIFLLILFDNAPLF